MTTRTTTIAALLLAGAGIAGGLAATAASDTGAERQAASSARNAEKALARRKADKAVAAAETAVALSPRVAAYRTLLGQAYLGAGRFASAVGALSDAVALDPSDGVAALHLALAQVATGDWGGARSTLTLHEKAIPASDRGLALALAGDPAGAVTVLTAAARAPDADAKTRQNLALALALAGRWPEARTVAALDVSPADVDKRIMQWATFAQPHAASDQVAALLGVTPVADSGQPERLALREAAPSVAALAQPIAAAGAYVAAAEPAVEVAPQSTASAEVSFTADVPAKAAVTFAPRQEIIQAVPARTSAWTMAAPGVGKARMSRAAWPRPVAAAARPQAGNYYVQLGAFRNGDVARDAWNGMRRNKLLQGMQPQGATFNFNKSSYYRLSVGNFARADADRLCSQLRASGGRCFVRAAAGDAVAQWHARGVQQAASVALRYRRSA